ncbi:MAG: M14 family zinc carboxypeptidase [Clostridia bacterium]|nr:M14 family zinc carboxypeptidase [Clostridia bacterium]MDD4375517.1 M14 family zinc carboxypeptidase [Clostridia bacterium]
MKTLSLNSSGLQVKYLQILLSRQELYLGEIDGIFGDETMAAVREFQELKTINVTGLADDSTWNALIPHSVIPDSIPYSYDIMMFNIDNLKLNYPFLKFGKIGTSVMGKEIPYIQIGFGDTKILYVASTHANEWITSLLLMKFINEFSHAYLHNQKIFNQNADDIFKKSSIYIVPMHNPDGVDLVVNDIDVSSQYYNNAVKISKDYPTIPFPDGWKANINGIDLNLQFPALWENAKEIKEKQGYVSPAPRDFTGNSPLEAPEALLLYDFTIFLEASLMISYHTQGEVIFWKFMDFTPPRAKEIGDTFSSISGYKLSDTPYASSFAGFKDWFIQKFNKPGYTIEAGFGINPLPLEQFGKIYEDNLGILTMAPLLA